MSCGGVRIRIPCLLIFAEMRETTMARLPDHPDDLKMSLGEHLEELRRRIIWSLLAIALGMVLCLTFVKPLMKFLVAPVHAAVQAVESENRLPDDETLPADGVVTRRSTGDSLLIVLTPLELFVTAMKTALAAGVVLASPVVVYQLWLFVAAGLYPHERRVVHIFIPFSVVLFLAGTTFAYAVVLKYGLPLLLNFAGLAWDIARPSIRLSAAISFVLTMSVVMGVVFQLPLVMMALAKVGLVSHETYVKKWKYAIVLIVVLAALLTPPDVFTQMAMAGPMIALYWLGVLLSKMVGEKH